MGSLSYGPNTPGFNVLSRQRNALRSAYSRGIREARRRDDTEMEINLLNKSAAQGLPATGITRYEDRVGGTMALGQQMNRMTGINAGLAARAYNGLVSGRERSGATWNLRGGQQVPPSSVPPVGGSPAAPAPAPAGITQVGATASAAAPDRDTQAKELVAEARKRMLERNKAGFNTTWSDEMKALNEERYAAGKPKLDNKLLEAAKGREFFLNQMNRGKDEDARIRAGVDFKNRMREASLLQSHQQTADSFEPVGYVNEPEDILVPVSTAAPASAAVKSAPGKAGVSPQTTPNKYGVEFKKPSDSLRSRQQKAVQDVWARRYKDVPSIRTPELLEGSVLDKTLLWWQNSSIDAREKARREGKYPKRRY